MVFTAPVDGVTTRNSCYPRSELREMNGEQEASWSNGSGTHTLRATEAVTELPPSKPELVTAQIHGGDDDIMQIRLEGRHLMVQYDDGAKQVTLDSDYQLGTPYDIEIVAAENSVQVGYNGEQKADLPLSGSTWYFKAGAYVQSNPSKGDARPAAGQVIIYSLEVDHTTTGAAARPRSTPNRSPSKLFRISPFDLERHHRRPTLGSDVDHRSRRQTISGSIDSGPFVMSRHRDEQMARAIFAEHGRAMQFYATRLLGDAAAAEDVVQEALIRIWRHPEVLTNGQGSVRGWLLTTVRNIVISRSRARAVRPREIPESPANPAAVDDHASAVVASVTVHAALDTLTPEHRAVIEQVYLHGRDLDEVAAASGTYRRAP